MGACFGDKISSATNPRHSLANYRGRKKFNEGIYAMKNIEQSRLNTSERLSVKLMTFSKEMSPVEHFVNCKYHYMDVFLQ